ncbi:phosphoribosyltransferase family protein [Sporosarcina sp. YIM B06819]|uniref:phosphoribosyltransferase family protein n=1 Tax=Sporosarcina sp. YIM B06819 TaxID=3081769 RepID=UPI00298C0052|nr:phosphoribosyltransferase family protein [Sporosarcina sp. YIM B06819]
MTSSVLSTRETYHIVDDLTVEVGVHQNPYQFQLDELFQMATRINKKRSFLFVSKVLGKHLAVNPHTPLLVGSLLAMRYMEVVHGLNDPRATAIAQAIQTNEQTEQLLASIRNKPIALPRLTTFIGFAETATALGHAVFSTFNNNAKYIHTTREQINERTSIIDFEEEHSHATSHRVYARDLQFFQDDSEVVLVDDEITTGKTAINIIKTIVAAYPSKKIFTVVSILDWRSVEHRQRYRQLEKELGITIHAVTLVDGDVTVTGQPVLEESVVEAASESIQELTYVSMKGFMANELLERVTSISANGSRNSSPYLTATGRFGHTIEEDNTFLRQLEMAACHIKRQRRGAKTLVVGTGEFMYVPMQIASYMGSNVYFQATTRSPIYQIDRESYTIQNKFTFDSPENTGVVNHLYNIKPHQYDEIFIIVERMSSVNGLDTLLKELRKTQIPYVTIVTMTEQFE